MATEQTTEQRKRTFEATGLQDPLTTPTTITSNNLGTVSGLPFENPVDVPIFPVDGLDTEVTPPLQETGGEKQAQSFVDRLLKLNESTQGRASFTAEQEELQGVPELQKTQTDLSARLKTIQNEAKAIPLQLQEDVAGRGVTTGGLRPLQTARLRTNTIQALGVSSLLEASRGNLTTALDLVDRAVAQKYDPITEEINALTANLNLIINSPDFTREQQNRAQSQLDIQNQRTSDLEEKKADEKAVGEIAVDVAQKGGDAQTLREIQQQTDPVEAQRIATAAGFGIQTEVEDLQKDLLREQISKTQAQTAQIIADTSGITPTDAGQFATLVDAASNLVGAERGKTSRRAITQALANGDYTTAYAEIANNVEASLTGETKSRFANARTDFQVMAGMGNAIEEYAREGGDMSLLKGKTEEISRKLGILAEDPKATAIAVQLQREFQTYRNIMTGAAFTPAESREYASVNPRATASIELNLATIDGALNALENRITSTINVRIPSAEKLYDVVTGSAQLELDPVTAPVGTILDMGGVVYRKTGDDEFELIQ